MIILGNQKLIESKFSHEQEIEDVVVANAEYFFGPSSIFIPKKLIRTKGGFGTIPDGFALDLASRTWFVVEAELVRHSVWSHIAPQVAKQMIAVGSAESRQLLEEIVIQMYANDSDVKDKFREEGIREIDVRKVLGDIFRKAPIIGMPIDRTSQDLKDWAETLRNDVRLWLVRKYIDFDAPENVAYDIPDDHRPVLDTSDDRERSKSGIASFDVSIRDLLEAGFLQDGEVLVMPYKPRGGTQTEYKAVVSKDGSLEVLGKKFTSPSYAAVLGLQHAGSKRKTANGWISWRNKGGKVLADLRTEYLNRKEAEAEENLQDER